MASLIECVPNFSEGRRPEVLAEIVHAIGQIDGVSLLDQSRDETHNRSVVTFAGSAEPVVKAATAAVGRALELIDMSQHEGAHPRIGAVDVIPFVPLGNTRLEECVDLARRFGELIAKLYDLPVYLYGAAALRPDRQRLADVRRGQYEGLKLELGTNPERDPDFGPASPASPGWSRRCRRPEAPHRLQRESRHGRRRGRPPHLRRHSRVVGRVAGGAGDGPAAGEPRRAGPPAQVSLNLVDWEQTGIATVVNEIRRLAREAGTDVDHCELIGLAPTAALLEVAADALGLRDFTPDQALELRLARDR